MAANVNKWSETPASNATADPAINWAEGQAPSTVNDSARQMMAAIAGDRDDTRGSLTFGGTSAALTLATNSVNATYQNGLRVSGKLASAFTAGATLNVDSVGAKNIYRITGTGAAAIQPSDGATGQHVAFEYDASLNSSAGGWVLIGEASGRVINVQIFIASGTYTRTPGASLLDVYVMGAGGASGGAPATAAGQFSLGGGGGAGSLTVAFNIAAPATAPYVVGAKGASNVGLSGSNGGQSSFNTTITAPGGGGGFVAGPAAGTTAFIGSAGSGGAAGAGGTIMSPGQFGGYSCCAASAAAAGQGGASPFLGFGNGGQGTVNGPSSAALGGNQGFGAAVIVVERA